MRIPVEVASINGNPSRGSQTLIEFGTAKEVRVGIAVGI
jgi:hypothetical protein